MTPVPLAPPARWHPRSSHLATALAVLMLACFAVSAPLAVAAREMTFAGYWCELLIAVPLMAVGLTVARRQPRNPIGWVFLVLTDLIALGNGGGDYALLVYRFGDRLPFGPVAALAALDWSLVIAAFPTTILLFPDGHLPSPRWQWALWAYLVVAGSWPASILAVAAQSIARHDMALVSSGDLRSVAYPAGHSAWLGTGESAVLPTVAAFWLLFVVRQVMSWRSAGGERRQQLKWLMGGAAVTIAATAFIAVGATLSPHAPAGLDWVVTAASLGLAALPLSVGVAILKYRLYDIDRIISRTLAYTIVTGLLVGVYAGLVLLVSVVHPIPGSVGVAAATLVAAALFNPLRRRVQRLVDRRFNRARYDAERTIAGFAARLSGTPDLDGARDDLMATVRAVLEPAHVSLWTAGGTR